MRFIRHVRAILGIAAFVLPASLFAVPHLYAIIAWNKLSRASPSLHRRRVARWQTGWGEPLFRLVVRIMGIEARFSFPDDPIMRDPCRPLIVISNHQSTLDILLLVILLVRSGRTDIRWILKKQLLSAPIIGRSCRETVCGSVIRKRQGSDIEQVRRCAEAAAADRASVIIFPEGTRFIAAMPGSGYARVLPPKIRGFLTLREALPDYPVLSVIIDWRESIEGTTMWSAAAFVGKSVSVSGRLVADIGRSADQEWIFEEWRRKDIALARRSS